MSFSSRISRRQSLVVQPPHSSASSSIAPSPPIPGPPPLVHHNDLERRPTVVLPYAYLQRQQSLPASQGGRNSSNWAQLSQGALTPPVRTPSSSVASASSLQRAESNPHPYPFSPHRVSSTILSQPHDLPSSSSQDLQATQSTEVDSELPFTLGQPRRDNSPQDIQ